jgi:hypothetical protein
VAATDDDLGDAPRVPEPGGQARARPALARIADALERIADAVAPRKRKHKHAPEIEVTEVDRAAGRAAARRLGLVVREKSRP